MIKAEKPMVEERLVRIAAGQTVLHGTLRLPEGARAIVLFAHGSGSGRHSPRNIHVARVLNEAHLATLLIDLLSADEEAADRYTAHLRFDIGLLTDRLVNGFFFLVTGGGATAIQANSRSDPLLCYAGI
jgi:putative phosphoribosyl transferase